MKTDSKPALFRMLPSVDELLRRPALVELTAKDGVALVTDAAREVLESVRQQIASGLLDAEGVELALSGLEAAVQRYVRSNLRLSLRTVINATGVILHTNMGRAPLSEAALKHASEIATTYSNVEFDVTSGERGKRDAHVERLFRRLIDENPDSSNERAGPPSPITTIVVNNNAAAVLLALNTLADGGEVIVSRGELVEIGESFRIPDLMAKSNAILREVGTTNRTRIQDYEQAITEKTRVLLRVHRSNFEITGFTEQPTIRELVDLAQRRRIPLLEDLGSGALFDLSSVGVSAEPGVLDGLRAGVDVVTYSGDKLLGGPQAGLLSGRGDLIARMRSNSLFRALRVDKLIYAVLEATLLAYVKGDHDSIPALRMMRMSQREIADRAQKIVSALVPQGLQVEVIDGESIIGGGAAPSATLPTKILALTGEGLSAEDIAVKLRWFDPPVVGRVEDGRVLLDLRTVFPEQDDLLLAAIRSARNPKN